jgi:RNA polymerase sigma-70 factor (ECF subfamily)
MRPEVEQALSALKRGEVEQGLQLLERTVLSFGMKVCGHREDAEDTAQEVLLKLLPYVAKFENAKAFSVWLYTVARNRCLMSRRRSKFAPKEELALDELMPSAQELASLNARPHATPESLLLSHENSAHVRDALDRIPPQYRLVLVLHDMEELDTSEIAKVTRLREGTVRVRLHRARLALRKELARREHGKADSMPRTQSSTKPRSCREIFAALSDYLDKELDPVLCAKLEKHMVGCHPCEAFLAELERTVQRCRSYQPECRAGSKNEVKSRVLAEYGRVLRALGQKKSSSS